MLSVVRWLGRRIARTCRRQRWCWTHGPGAIRGVCRGLPGWHRRQLLPGTPPQIAAADRSTGLLAEPKSACRSFGQVQHPVEFVSNRRTPWRRSASHTWTPPDDSGRSNREVIHRITDSSIAVMPGLASEAPVYWLVTLPMSAPRAAVYKRPLGMYEWKPGPAVSNPVLVAHSMAVSKPSRSRPFSPGSCRSAPIRPSSGSGYEAGV